jgi:cytochrome c5
MNLRSTLLPALVTAVLGGAALQCAPPAEARSAQGPPLLPARFFVELSVGAAVQADSGKQTADPGLPEGKGKDVTERVCSGCHAVNVFTKLHHTRDEWASVLDTMASRGMDASDAEVTTMTDYLTKYLGPVKKDSAAPPAGDGSGAKPPSR